MGLKEWFARVTGRNATRMRDQFLSKHVMQKRYSEDPDAYEAPADKVRGEIFNVLHSNYQIRELAMLVAGSVQRLASMSGN